MVQVPGEVPLDCPRATVGLATTGLREQKAERAFLRAPLPRARIHLHRLHPARERRFETWDYHSVLIGKTSFWELISR